MKNLIFFFFLIPQLIFAQKPEVAFRIGEKDLIPEGIAYDKATNSFYVGSIYKKKIIRIDNKGKISEFVPSGKDGLGQVVGMKVKSGRLWVCSNTGEQNPQGQSMVHVFDLTTGNLVNKWILNANGEIHFFNDLVVTDNGSAFISDSDYNAIYTVSQNFETPQLFVKDNQLRYANGITQLPNGDIITNSSRGFFRISSEKKIFELPFDVYYPIGVDGLYFYNQSLIGIQNVTFPTTVTRYFLNAAGDKIEKGKVLAFDHPDWNIPTTGAIAGDWFYFIANSQMRSLENNVIKDPSKLKEVLIMKVKLK